MNLFDLTGKKVIVTGGAGGLGRGIVEVFAEQGAQVLIVDISEKAHTRAEELCAAGYNCKALVADLGSRVLVEKAFAAAMGLLDGSVDVLVNAAGICRRRAIEEFTEDDWEDVININLSSVFYLSQAAARVMLKNGYGKIINIASMISYFGGYSVPSYAASKGGVLQLTRSFSNEWAARGLNINAVAPGYMDTTLNVDLINDPVRSKEILARIPAKRWGKPEDLKGVMIFLASHASDYLNGAIIPVDGGYLGR